MKLYKTSDRIKVKIGDMVVTVSPLSYFQKLDVYSESGEMKDDMSTTEKNRIIAKSSIMAMRHAIKEVSGIEPDDGREFKLQFKDDMLTNECAEALLMIQMPSELMAVCSSVANNMTGINDIAGVKIIDQKKKVKKKK